jgi:hypothetical protein
MDATIESARLAPSASISGLRGEAIIAAGAVLVAGLTAMSALALNPRFFITDDYATYFMPSFREIARQLYAGHIPLITERLWNGGALIQEYQYAIFNPVSLTLYSIIGNVPNLATAAAIYSVFHIMLFAGGVYLLGRALGASAVHAALAAVVAPTSSAVFYWGAANWIPTLVSSAWLAWAWGFLVLTYRRPSWAPAAALTTALTLLSGWPFANLALAVSAITGAALFVDRGDRTQAHQAVAVVFALIVGGLLAMPAIVPLEIYLSYTGRSVGGGAWATPLSALLEVGMPNFIDSWKVFTGAVDIVPHQTVYVAWFVPLALLNADFRKLMGKPGPLLVGILVIVYAMLSMLPGFWQYRWMFRMLPYFQLAILILSSIALTRAAADGKGWSVGITAAFIGAEVWVAMCAAPALWYIDLLAGYSIGALLFLTVRDRGKFGLRWSLLALGLYLATFWVALWSEVGGETGGRYPHYPNAWSPPVASEIPAEPVVAGPTRYAIFPPLTALDPGQRFWSAFTPGNTGLEHKGTTIVGYSPIGARPYAEHLCFGHLGATSCDDIVARVSRPVGETGEPLLDLMSVDQVIIQRKSDADAFRAARPTWREQRGAAGEWRFTRPQSLGPAPWSTRGVSATVRSASSDRIEMTVENRSMKAGRLSLSRAWYPGWRATLNGKDLEVRPISGFILAVDIPANSAGALTVSFWPAGLSEGLALAAVGALLLAAYLMWPGLLYWPGAVLQRLVRRPTEALA